MIQLRDAQFSDYAAIAKLHTESWRKTYRGIYSDSFLDHEVEQERLNVWQHKLKSPNNNQQVIIATFEDTVIGFACLYLNNDPVFGSLLDNLHVSTTLQKSGIGKLLMKECAKHISNKSKCQELL